MFFRQTRVIKGWTAGEPEDAVDHFLPSHDEMGDFASELLPFGRIVFWQASRGFRGREG